MTDPRFRTVYASIEKSLEDVPRPEEGFWIAVECGNDWLQDYQFRDGKYVALGPRYVPATLD